VKLAPCHCSRWPEYPCSGTADAEDLLCSACRPRKPDPPVIGLAVIECTLMVVGGKGFHGLAEKMTFKTGDRVTLRQRGYLDVVMPSGLTVTAKRDLR
jgi:hypothetical protein